VKVMMRVGETHLWYKLDVSRKLPNRAQIVDEDEFQEAANKYGYSAEFIPSHAARRELHSAAG
jgi:protein associated with RNAse G/E